MELWRGRADCDPDINALRERQIRNMPATLLLSQGTPMLLAGDEFGRTQSGNNNAYAQDEISWLNWDLHDTGRSLVSFVQKLCALRQKYPVLRRNLFLTGNEDVELGIKDVTWINANGAEMQHIDWADPAMRCFGMLIDGLARPTGVRQRGTEAAMLIVLNAHHDLVEFALPTIEGATHWALELDTNVMEVPRYKGKPGERYGVTGRSLALFIGTVAGE